MRLRGGDRCSVALFKTALQQGSRVHSIRGRPARNEARRNARVDANVTGRLGADDAQERP